MQIRKNFPICGYEWTNVSARKARAWDSLPPSGALPCSPGNHDIFACLFGFPGGLHKLWGPAKLPGQSLGFS